MTSLTEQQPFATSYFVTECSTRNVRVLPAGTGQQHLAAAQHEGFGRAQAGLELLAFVIGWFTHKYRWLRTSGVSHRRLPRLRLQ
jgi:hypothetical protein